MNRRQWLQLTGTGALATSVDGQGRANANNEALLQNALIKLTNGQAITTDKRVHIELPDTAENSAIVPATIRSSVPGTRRIGVFISDHDLPLVAELYTSQHIVPSIFMQIKLERPCVMVALVQTDKHWFTNRADISQLFDNCEH